MKIAETAVEQPRVKKVVKNVTLPQLKIITDTPMCVTFMKAIWQGAPEDDARVKDGAVVNKRKEPPFLAEVRNEDTGEIAHMVVPTVLRKELEKQYAGEAYVLKSFDICQHKLPGKDYNTFDIAEVSFE